MFSGIIKKTGIVKKIIFNKKEIKINLFRDRLVKYLLK